MSGFIGILNLDGAPADHPLLQRITDFMAFRGPDEQRIWHAGAVGFGHAMLRTTHEQAREQQPCSLDSQTWITADARIDGRPELKRALQAAGRHEVENATDVELILHAYHAWGEACVQHLLGDFAFAIWDGAQRKLFCARDHFGVRLFYYAQTKGALVFSNTLNSMHMHPAVSTELNEAAIGDFLLFNYNLEFDTTIFAGIRQLAPAHTLTWVDGAVRVQRYWALPVEGELRYKQPTEYVEHYRELLKQSVGDRLRTDQSAILLSGGLDSTSIAATARQLHSAADDPFVLHACSYAFEDDGTHDLDPDYAALVAQKLNFPIHYFNARKYKPFERWDDPNVCPPEPINRPLHAMRLDVLREASSHGRVILSGDGGDSVFYPSSRHLVDLLKKLRLVRLISDVRDYWRMYGHRPPLYFGTYLRKKMGIRQPQPPYPAWLNQAFVERAHLQQRWEQDAVDLPQVHPTRYEAYATLCHALWPHRFTNLDASVTHTALEARYPFFDVRLATGLLRFPPMPWFIHKHIQRTAMLGLLPEQVRNRPKAIFPHTSDDLPKSEQVVSWSAILEKVPGIAKWVDVDEYMNPSNRLLHMDPSTADSESRPASFAWWLCCNNCGILPQ